MTSEVDCIYHSDKVAVWPFRRKTANYNKKYDTEMEYDEVMGARLSAIEARPSRSLWSRSSKTEPPMALSILAK